MQLPRIRSDAHPDGVRFAMQGRIVIGEVRAAMRRRWLYSARK